MSLDPDTAGAAIILAGARFHSVLVSTKNKQKVQGACTDTRAQTQKGCASSNCNGAVRAGLVEPPVSETHGVTYIRNGCFSGKGLGYRPGVLPGASRPKARPKQDGDICHLRR